MNMDNVALADYWVNESGQLDWGARTELVAYVTHKIGEAKSRRAAFETVWGEVENLIEPYRLNENWQDAFDVNNGSGRKRFTNQFKEPLYHVIHDSISNYIKYTADLSTKFIEFCVTPKYMSLIGDDPEIDKFILERLVPAIESILANERYKFVRSTYLRHYDAFVYGTGCRYAVFEGAEAACMHVPIKNMFWERDQFTGELSMAGCDIELTREEAVKRWGNELEKIEAWGGGDFEIFRKNAYSIKETFTHVVFSRTSQIFNSFLPEFINNDTINNNYYKRYVELVLSGDKLLFIKFAGHFMPYIIADFEPSSHPHRYGTSPLFSLISTIKFNETLKTNIGLAIYNNIYPALATTSTSKLKSGDYGPNKMLRGILVHGKGGQLELTARPMVAPVDVKGISNILEKTEKEIANLLTFGSKAILAADRTAGMSPTQVQELMNAHDTTLAPPVQNWVDCDLKPTLARVLNYVMNEQPRPLKNELHDRFPILKEAAADDFALKNFDYNDFFDLKYVGQLLQARRRYESIKLSEVIQETAQAVSTVAQVASLDQSISQSKVINEKLRAANLSCNVQKSKEERAQDIFKARQQQAAQPLREFQNPSNTNLQI